MNDIKPIDPTAGTLIPIDQIHGDDVFGEIASSGNFLPRLQMFGGNSELVKEGKMPMAHYGLISGKNLTQLGAMVDILPVAWRPKAMDISDDEIITVFDNKSDEFKRIQTQADVQDSGCMFGPEFLVWIPSQKKFALLYMQSKTSRREAPAVRERLGMPTTLKSHLIKTPKYSWHGIVCTQCSTPFDLPTEEELSEQVSRFNNPPASETEKVDPTAPGRAR